MGELRQRRDQSQRSRSQSQHSHVDCKASHHHAEHQMGGRLLKASELPAWMRDNDFIETMYRPQLSSWLDCLKSGFFYFTNESVNIWTHFVASVLFSVLAVLFCVGTGIWSSDDMPYYVRTSEVISNLKDAAGNTGVRALNRAIAAAGNTGARAVEELAHLKAAAGETGARAVEEFAHLKAAAGETGARAVEELAMLKAAAGITGARAVEELAHLKAAAGARAVEELVHLKAAAGEKGARAVEELAILKAAAGVTGARAVAAAGETGARMLKAAAGEKNVEELGVASVKAITELSRRARGLAVGTLPLLIAAAFCTAMSTAFHVFWCMSPDALRIFGQLDFMGIATLCAGHAWTGVFYAFYCSPTIRNRYFVGILAALLASMNVIMSSKFRAKESRRYRAAVFSCLGSSIVVPVIHSGILHEWKLDAYPTFAVWMVAAGISYLIGVVLYASRVPECCRPGKHDGWWSSHQLMHCAVIIGASFHTYGCHLLISYRIERGCAFSPLI